MNNIKRKVLALVLVLSMAVTLTPSIWVGYAVDGSGAEATGSVASEAAGSGSEAAVKQDTESPKTAEPSPVVKPEAEAPKTAEPSTSANSAQTGESSSQEAAKETPAPASGEVLQVIESETEKIKPDADIAEPEELFDGYLKAKAYNARTRKTVGSRLKGANKALYNYLNTEIAKVAAGQRSSTKFEYTAKDLFGDKNYWTAAELGLDSLTDSDGEITGEALVAVEDMQAVLNALLADNPYALYWFDKVRAGWYTRFYYELMLDENGEEILVAEDVGDCGYYYMPVVKEYSVSKTAGTYEFDTDIGKSTSTVVNKAQSIVDKYASSDDEARLTSYADEICRLVSYNHDAAAGDGDYGDPWQLIWVFDGDTSTNVVCEGYSKAFKFLCDLTEFKGTVDCITVTGWLYSGGHMWNVVTLDDGYNYIADVTSSDGGSKYVDWGIFLCKEPDESSYPTYEFNGLTYTYDEECMDTFRMNELAIPGDGSGHIPQDDPIVEPVQVETLEFEFSTLRFYEGLGGGYGHYDYNLGEYVETDYYYYDYDLDSEILREGNKITVNGTTYTCNRYGNYVSDNGVKLKGTIRATDDQSADNPWSASNPGHVTITYKDGTCTVPVRIEKSPITEFRIEFAEEQVLYGGIDDYVREDTIWNSETGEWEEVSWSCFWYGRQRVRNCFDGDVLVLNGDRYVCHIENNVGYFENSAGKRIPEDDVVMFDYQSPYEPWGPGEHEVDICFYLDNILAAECTSTVLVVADPVDSVRFVPGPNFTVAKDDYDEYHFCYDEGDKFIIEYNDGRGEVTYTAKNVTRIPGLEWLKFVDPDGNYLDDDYIDEWPLYDEIDDDWEEGIHTFYLKYHNHVAEFDAYLTFDWSEHDLVMVPEKPATCTTAGNIEYYRCTDCGLLFADPRGREEISKSETVIKAFGHSKKSVPAVAATCQHAGEKAHYECEICGTYLDKNGKVLSSKAKKKLVVKKKAHSYKKKITTDEYLKSKATCTKKATYYYACSMCGLKGKKTYTVGKALGHSYENVLTPATPTKDGSIVKKCTRCGKKAKTTKIYKASKVTIDKKYQTVAYKGDNLETTTVSVKTSKKKAISKDYYDLSFDNNYETGIGTVTVTFKGNYSGTKTLTYKITGIPKPEPQETDAGGL